MELVLKSVKKPIEMVSNGRFPYSQVLNELRTLPKDEALLLPEKVMRKRTYYLQQLAKRRKMKIVRYRKPGSKNVHLCRK